MIGTRQLLATWARVADENGRIDFDGLLSKIEEVGTEACAIANRLHAGSPIEACQRLFDLSQEFNELGALFEATLPEAKRAGMAISREGITREWLRRIIAVSEARANEV